MKPVAERFERRLAFTIFAATFVLLIVVGRLIQVQIVEAGPLRREAKSQQSRTLEVPAARGSILDSSGEALALTVPADRRGTRESDRLYPHGDLAAQVIGCCSSDGRGLEGIELLFDELLQGKSGSRVVGANARGHRFTTPSSRMNPPEDGASVVLTIDANAQSVLERELGNCVKRNGAQAAVAILLDPRSGDILAMGCYPTYDPDLRGESAERRRNRAITDIFEPGSTFKVVTVAGCFEKGLAGEETLVESAKELSLAGNERLRDKKDYGWVTVEEAVTLSVNTATAQLARKLGKECLYETARSFGFGCITGIELPGEASGILRRPIDWSARSLETISIGQEVAVTPLQLACAYAAIANEGVLMRPRLVREVRDSSGRTIRRFRTQEVRRVVSKSTASHLTSILTGVVDHGTGEEAAIPGVTVAGKTGTAQRIDPKTNRYDAGRHVSSFVGFLPVENPSLVGVVVVDRPRGVGYGGQIAAPCFRRIVEGTFLQSRTPGVVRSDESKARGS
jgi:cell division protein FtsI (penicillin-binding protein 3)